MARFQVIDSFAVESRELFVFAGSILEGEIRAGMVVSIPFNSAFTMSMQIHCIEFIRRANSREDVCLCFRYAEPDELSVWRGLNINNEVVEVLESGSSSA